MMETGLSLAYDYVSIGLVFITIYTTNFMRKIQIKDYDSVNVFYHID